VGDPVLTAEEWKRVRAYDERCRQEIEAEERQPARPNALGELLQALEAEALEEIRDVLEEIGTLTRCRETFRDRERVDTLNVLMWQLRYKLEDARDDILRWRSYAKEFSRV